MEELSREEWIKEREKVVRRQKMDEIKTTTIGVVFVGSILILVLVILL